MDAQLEFFPDSKRDQLQELRGVVTVSKFPPDQKAVVERLAKAILSEVRMPVYIHQDYVIHSVREDLLILTVQARAMNLGFRSGSVTHSYEKIRQSITDAVAQFESAVNKL